VALLTSGYIRTWGYGLYGELGMNNTTTYTTPQTPSIPGNPTISKIWAAGLLNCGVSFLQDSSGIIWSAGYNGYGQLGVGDVANKLIFTRVLGVAFPNAATVSDIQFCGYDSYLAVLFMLADGRCLGCGKNAIGMLGINPFGAYDSPVPTPVIF
jgi:alpha-tubulin suppressor-like RCC1 family protein